jgi:HK97 family phage major capsid protein
MSKILELREKRGQKLQAAKDYLDSKRGGDDMVSEEDAKVYDSMIEEVNAFSREIDRLEAQDALERKISAPMSTPILNTPGASVANRKNSGTGRSADEYTREFWNTMRGGYPVRNVLEESEGTKGAYLVPDEFERTLIEALQENNIMRQLARVVQTSSGTLKIPVVASQGAASWVEESASIPESDSTFGEVTLSAYKIATMIRVSQELMADSAFPLDTFLASEFGRRIGVLEEEAFISGNGTGKPTGFLQSAQAGKTAATATSLTFDDVIGLYYSLKAPYRNKAVFITNEATVELLQKLKDSNQQYIWKPSISDGVPNMIFNRPVYTSSYMPAVAAGAKAIAFGDFSYYWIGDRQGRTFQRLDELFSANDQIGFKATQRVDGKLVLPEAVKLLTMATA